MSVPQTPLPDGDLGAAGWAVGWIAFAGVMMIMIGIFQAVDGIVGIFKDDVLVQGPKYAYSLSTTGWGWIHLILGIIIVIAGIGLFSGNLAARIVAITLAMLSAIANFLWLPYYPVWSIIVIALNVAVIWALTTHGDDMRVRS